MINGKRIAVVLPAYNAEKTLEATVRELHDLVDIRIRPPRGAKLRSLRPPAMNPIHRSFCTELAQS